MIVITMISRTRTVPEDSLPVAWPVGFSILQGTVTLAAADLLNPRVAFVFQIEVSEDAGATWDHFGHLGWRGSPGAVDIPLAQRRPWRRWDAPPAGVLVRARLLPGMDNLDFVGRRQPRAKPVDGTEDFVPFAFVVEAL